MIQALAESTAGATRKSHQDGKGSPRITTTPAKAAMATRMGVTRRQLMPVPVVTGRPGAGAGAGAAVDRADHRAGVVEHGERVGMLGHATDELRQERAGDDGRSGGDAV